MPQWTTDALAREGCSRAGGSPPVVVSRFAAVNVVGPRAEPLAPGSWGLNMFGLNTSRLPPEVSAILLARGTALPPLRWPSIANRAAKRALDALEDARLLGSRAVLNDGMGSTIRAMLFLWNGWAGDCAMCAQSAPASEKAYIAGLCERHLAHPDNAKRCFQQLATHPIFGTLGSIVSGFSSADLSVRRFIDIVKQGGTWEPFAFIDLVEQAAAGAISNTGVEQVCQIQCHEFAVLLSHCFQLATGEVILDPEGEQQRAKRAAPPPRALRKKPARKPEAAPEADAPRPREAAGGSHRPAAAIAAPPARPPVKVKCPKCQTVIQFPASFLGRAARCPSCLVPMLVPRLG